MAIDSISARKNQFSIKILAKPAPCYLALNSYKIEENFMDGPRLVEMGGYYMAVLNIKWELRGRRGRKYCELSSLFSPTLCVPLFSHELKYLTWENLLFFRYPDSYCAYELHKYWRLFTSWKNLELEIFSMKTTYYTEQRQA